jgi:hypothetical protein
LGAFDDYKGERISPRRTVCELTRQLYDLCVCRFFESDPEFLATATPMLEEILVGANKMNKRLAQHKLDVLTLFQEPNDKDKARELRNERLRLTAMIQENDAVISTRTGVFAG